MLQSYAETHTGYHIKWSLICLMNIQTGMACHFCCKIIQYQISWICIQSCQDVTHIQIDKVIFNKHSAEMWTNLKI